MNKEYEKANSDLLNEYADVVKDAFKIALNYDIKKTFSNETSKMFYDEYTCCSELNIDHSMTPIEYRFYIHYLTKIVLFKINGVFISKKGYMQPEQVVLKNDNGNNIVLNCLSIDDIIDFTEDLDIYPDLKSFSNYVFCINPQVKVGKYTIDFLVTLYRYGSKYYTNGNIEKLTDIAIELDGHDFHEKTKQQSEKDKRRYRDLLNIGINTLRFTGSEVYKNVDGVLNEVFDHIVHIANRYYTEEAKLIAKDM